LSALPTENHKIVAVAARNLTDAKKFAEKFEIPKFYAGYESLAKDEEVGEFNNFKISFLPNSIIYHPHRHCLHRHNQHQPS
jgi:hypothetical protein